MLNGRRFQGNAGSLLPADERAASRPCCSVRLRRSLTRNVLLWWGSSVAQTWTCADQAAHRCGAELLSCWRVGAGRDQVTWPSCEQARSASTNDGAYRSKMPDRFADTHISFDGECNCPSWWRRHPGEARKGKGPEGSAPLPSTSGHAWGSRRRDQNSHKYPGGARSGIVLGRRDANLECARELRGSLGFSRVGRFPHGSR